MEEYKYPVFIYVPEKYQPTKKYPLIISLPAKDESVEMHIKSWAKLGTRKSLIILVPTTQSRESDVPYRLDRWLLDLKEDVMKRYQVNPARIYLVGNGDNAHYAAYLGVQFPEEFSAVGLLGGSWVGPFGKIMNLNTRPSRQIPFYVSLRADDIQLVEQTEKMAYEFQEKGYPVYLEKLDEKEDLDSSKTKTRMLAWLDEKSQQWISVVEESKKTFKEKLYEGIDNLITETS
ncbi:MAG: hypothetical protein JW893_01660 [Candidatus Omnitrophica bacterium]|nr:hypothetical protein [Candidatus Omnitrophota bacterium]